MKKIEKLTQDQENKMPIYLNKYFNKVYKNQPFDKSLFIDAIQHIYNYCSYKKPAVWICDSPVQAQIIANLISNKKNINLWANLRANLWANLRDNLGANLGDNLWDNLGANLGSNLWDNLRDNLWANLGANLGDNLRDNLRANLWANLRDNLWANLGDNLWDNLGDNLGDNLWANLRANLRANLWANLRDNLGDNLGSNLWDNLGSNLGANLWANLWANLGDNLWANLGDNLGSNLWANLWANLGSNLGDNLGSNLWDNLGDNLRAMKMEYIPFSWYGNISDYGWTCFYEFINTELIPDYKFELWDNWLNLINSNFYDMIQFEGLVIVVKMPIKVNIDDRNRLHSENDYAVKFNDGYGVCAWHGVIVDSKIILDADYVTPELITNEQNAEIRRCMLEKYGRENFLSISTKVQSDDWGELYKNEGIRDINNEPYCFVKVVNSTPEPDGKYKDYILRVNPSCKTAFEAVQSTFPRIKNFVPSVET